MPSVDRPAGGLQRGVINCQDRRGWAARTEDAQGRSESVQLAAVLSFPADAMLEPREGELHQAEMGCLALPSSNHHGERPMINVSVKLWHSITLKAWTSFSLNCTDKI